jgi:hypothetical protein
LIFVSGETKMMLTLLPKLEETLQSEEKRRKTKIKINQERNKTK